jgi:hypothetical protein
VSYRENNWQLEIHKKGPNFEYITITIGNLVPKLQMFRHLYNFETIIFPKTEAKGSANISKSSEKCAQGLITLSS